VKASLDQVVPVETDARAMFVDKEVVTSMTDLPDDLMLIGVFNLAILIAKNCEIVHRIDDPD